MTEGELNNNNLSHKTDRRSGYSGREWPPVEESLEAAYLWPIKELIQRRHSTITAYITNRPIYELCTGAENIPGYSIFTRWWDKYVVWEVE